MSRSDSRRAIARTLAARADEQRWSTWRLASAISEQTGCGLLQAHRLAQGWTLETTRARLADLGARVTVQQLSMWESHRGRPGETNLDHLCRLYATRPDRLGYGHDYTPTDQPDEIEVHTPVYDLAAPETTSVITADAVPGTGPLTAATLSALRALRRGMVAVLEPSICEAAIEQRERRALEYGGYYQIVSPTRILAESAQDFAEARALLEQRMPADVRIRLCRIAAQLAGTAGIALVALGEHREARAWFHVAQLAADETGDRALRAWLLAREAVIPFYYGAPAPALALAERARLLAGSTPCATAAWAPSLEARALARMGRQREAQDALRLAQTIFLRLEAADTADTAYGYTERQLVWHEGSMWTALGDTRRAQAALRRAHELYAPTEFLDQALIALDEATCLIRVGETTVACREAGRVLLSLPPEHLTGIVVNRARDLLLSLPARAAHAGATQDLREVIHHCGHPALTTRPGAGPAAATGP